MVGHLYVDMASGATPTSRTPMVCLPDCLISDAAPGRSGGAGGRRRTAGVAGCWPPAAAGMAAGDTEPGQAGSLRAVFCTSATDCWAVGTYVAVIAGADLNLALHWNGRAWSQVVTSDPGGTTRNGSNALYGVSCAAARDCWAVGVDTTSQVEHNQALHWNEAKWSFVSTPSPHGLANGDVDILASVRCAASASCWAVGYQQPQGQNRANEALRWLAG